MDLEAYMRRCRTAVEAALNRALPDETVDPTELHRAMRYSVLAPGKRLRPILVLASAEAVGADPNRVMHAACGLECIHAFSLIHDDLPCMDDDDYRRGRPTNHVLFGEALALLAGDALLALGFELLTEDRSDLDPVRRVQALNMVARASGTRGMVGGQVADMESEGQSIDADALRKIHASKTGALLMASASVGAMLVGADDSRVRSLMKYGEHIGLAFQITDDILDIVGDESRIGKRVGSDLRQNKATYPKVLGLEGSREFACAEVEQAIEAIIEFGPAAEPLRAVARYVVERDR